MSLGIAVIFIVIAVSAVIRFAAPGVFVVLASPFWHAGSSLSAAVGQSTASFGNAAELTRARDALIAQNAQLENENRTLTARAQDLQNLLGTRTAAPAGIVAGVLARPPIAPYDVLIVDQGSNGHIQLGATAYGPGGTPIGTVATVAPLSARITLYSNPGLQTAAWVGDTRTPVTLIGSGSGAFTAILPKAAGVTEGQGVYAAGPGSVPVGVVVKVDSDPSSPNVTLDIRPYANPFSLTWVTISPNGL
jgi:cell shape-determining protein MreC